jgi:DNA repair protein RecN (Recombination protein N)
MCNFVIASLLRVKFNTACPFITNLRALQSMLTHLTISDFALVQHLDLQFERGMTVVSGETGAGKSIMLDALALTLGDRADINLIASGKDRAEIHSTFDLAGIDSAVSWLGERELIDDDNIVIMRRVINRDGRSRGFINGVPSRLADMKTLGNLLIDIHSQHEHQSLLKKETHRRLLDEYGNLEADADSLKAVFSTFKTCQSKLDQLTGDNQEQSARLQLLTYQAAELAQLDLQAGETGSLELEQKQLANAETTVQQCQQALLLCNADGVPEGEPEREADVLVSLARAISLISNIDDDRLQPIMDLLSSGLIQIEEATHDLEHYIQACEINPNRLSEVEKRLDAIYNVARKHRVDPSQIPGLAISVTQELAAIGNIEEDIDRLNLELDSLKTRYQRLATKLGKSRRKAALILEKEVSEKLTELGMSGARFQISLLSVPAGELTANGLEEIEFQISTNPGQKPGSLSKIASGGELSRISLAIQVVTAHTSNVPTLVFDEVDVGIGGAIAEVVGRLLRELGKNAQNICVTHLAQVAAQGHQHFKVDKNTAESVSTTVIVPLSEKEKVEEIARMLGGIELTDQSLAHAAEMFTTSQK